MKPAIPAALTNFAGRLRGDIVPQLTGFHAGNVAMIAAMLDMVAEEWDRAPARLVAENATLRALLARGAALVPGGGTPLDDDGDLRISALQAMNDRLRTLLIALHGQIEARDDDEARALDAAIWAFLRDSVEQRRISSANF
jgi:hypothetical protein